MEDAHTTILNLDGSPSDKNAFFAVYDGHGGMVSCSHTRDSRPKLLDAGATVARFSGDNVHKRLSTEETYQEKQFNAALKKAFLGTDEDMRAGMLSE